MLLLTGEWPGAGRAGRSVGASASGAPRVFVGPTGLRGVTYMKLQGLYRLALGPCLA